MARREIGTVQLSGLRELQRSMREVDRALPRTLRLALNKGADIIVSESQSKVPTRTGRAKASLKAASSQREVRIKAGSARAKYYPWLDFGGKVGRGHKTVRPFHSDGRYIYPSYYRLRDSGRLQRILEDALKEATRNAGLEVD